MRCLLTDKESLFFFVHAYLPECVLAGEVRLFPVSDTCSKDGQSRTSTPLLPAFGEELAKEASKLAGRKQRAIRK